MAFDVGAIKGKIVIDTGDYRIAISKVTDGQKKMTKGAKKTGSAFKGLWKQMAAGLGLTAGVAMAMRTITRQFSDMIRKGREFEREWANVTTMLSVSESETHKLRKELINLSPTLGDTTDLAKGMYQVLSASIEPAKAIQFLAEAAKSAKAGVTDTKTAVDALTTVINAYGLEAERVTDVSDIMFQTVKRGKLTYGELAHSLGTVVPIAATIGIKFEDVAAGISTMTRQGVIAQKATMQLRQVMSSILRPSDEAKKLAKELGLEFNAAALKAKGLSGFMADLREKTGGNAKMMATLVPNVRALLSVMILAGSGAKGFATDLELMAKASGSTEIAFRKQMKSGDFWIKVVGTSIDKFKISFYQGFVDPMKRGISTSRDLENRTKDLMMAFEALGKSVGEHAIAFLGRLIDKYKQTQGLINTVTVLIEGSTLAIKKGQIPTIKNAVKAWAEHQNALLEQERALKNQKKELIGFTGMFVENARAIKEHVAWILEDSKNSEEASRRIAEYRRALNEANKEVKATTTLLETQIPAVSGIRGEMSLWGQDIISLSDVTNNLHDDFEQLTTTAIPQARDFSDVWGLALDNLKTKSEDAGKKITKDFASALQRIGSLLQILADDVSEAWGNVISSIGLALDQIKKPFYSIKELLEQIGPGLTGKIGGSIGQLISGAKKSFASIGSALGAAVGSIIPGIGTALGSLAGGLLGGLFGKGKKETAEERYLKDLNARIEDITRVMGKYGEVSEDTAKKIAESSKSMTGYAAVSKHLADVIRDVGVTQENVSDLWIRASDVIHHFTDGELSASDATKSLNDSFKLLLDGTRELGEEGSKAMVKFILKVRRSGLEVKAITEYVTGQLGRIPDALSTLVDSVESAGSSWGELQKDSEKLGSGINQTEKKIGSLSQKLIEQQKQLSQVPEGSKAYKQLQKEIEQTRKQIASTKKEQADLINEIKKIEESKAYIIDHRDEVERLGLVALHSFNSMIASGASWIDAVNQMGDPIVALRDKYEEFGMAADPALQKLFDIIGVTKEHEKLFEAIDANKTIMEALGNSGYMTQDVFNALAADANELHKNLLDAGTDGDTALRMMGPTLENLRDYADAYNLKLDEGTQSLIDQATEIGAVKEAQEDNVEVQKRLFKELGADMRKGMMDSADKIGQYIKDAFADAFGTAEGEAQSAAINIGDTLSSIQPVVGIGFDYTLPDFSNLKGSANLKFAGGFQHEGMIEAGPYRPTAFVMGEGSKRERATIEHTERGSIRSPTEKSEMNLTMNFYPQKLDDNEIRRSAIRIFNEVEFQKRRRGL